MPNKRVKDIPTAIENDIKKVTNDAQFIQSEEKSELGKSIDSLQNPKRIETSTILTDEQVNAIVLMNWAAQVYDIQFFKEYVKSFPLYKISGGGGKGREQSIEIAKAVQINNEERDKRLSELFRR